MRESVQEILGSDDEAPSSPDGTGGHEGGICIQGEGFHRAVEVRDAC